ncbi:MAG: NAD(P)H-hydrate dehydratase [Phycisphaerae bacterium]
MTDIQKITQPPQLSPRPREGHKGTFGRVGIIGGSIGMVGAPALTAEACLRSGAGLAMMAVPACAQQTIASLVPCATSLPLPCDDDGQLSPRATDPLESFVDRNDILAAGPGFDVGDGQQAVLQWLLGKGKPLVIDADGLNNLAQMDDWPRLRSGPLVLTPHPGEFARLTGRSIGDIQSDREALIVEAASEWRARADIADPLVVVLKGAGTCVSDGRRLYVNDTGNPGMASGGTGDVLTGITAALLGQGLDAFDAACLAVWVHGAAGDAAAAELGEVSVMATDLLDFLPQAFQQATE